MASADCSGGTCRLLKDDEVGGKFREFTFVECAFDELLVGVCDEEGAKCDGSRLNLDDGGFDTKIWEKSAPE